MLTAPKPETTFELCPSGTHLARLYKIINLGTHDGEWQGRPKVSSLVRLYWELPNEMKEYEKDGQMVRAPFAISREFTFSMGEKANLRRIVEGMIGTTLSDDEAYGFDIEQLLGMPCLATVVHETGKSSGKKFAMLTTVAPVMRGMEVPPQFNKSEVLNVSEMTEEEIGKLPPWLADKMRESHEYKRKNGTMITENTGEPVEQDSYPELTKDEIPF
jgi:hypothetical protein